MLSIQHLTRVYRGHRVVDDLTMKVPDGHACLLLGPNGSGKTTLMKMIVGLTHPTSGEIRIGDTPVGVATKACTAYMPTEDCFYNYMTVADARRWQMDFYTDFDEIRFDDMLKRMSLNPKDTIRKMSSGMRAKLRLALALSRDAKLAMLDEPLNGVDIITRTQIIDEISTARANGRTMLISTHLADELEPVVDDLALLSEGRLLAYGPKAEILGERTLTQLYIDTFGGGSFSHA